MKVLLVALFVVGSVTSALAGNVLPFWLEAGGSAYGGGYDPENVGIGQTTRDGGTPITTVRPPPPLEVPVGDPSGG